MLNRDSTKKRREKRASRWRRPYVFLCASVPLWLFVGLMLFLDLWGRRERIAPADCIIVLGARVQPGGVAGQSLRARTTHAVGLYKRGVARKLLFTGGLGDYAPEEARVAAKLARRLGVPQSDIALELESHSTWENARNAVQIARSRGWRSGVVVSDAFHLWRATRDFSRLGFPVSSSPCDSSWMNARFGLRAWYDAREAAAVLRDFVLGPS